VEKTKNLLTINYNPITEMVEFRVKNKSGKWHYLECTANIINNKMLFVSKDITERKQAEDKLQTESNKVTTILELMVDGAYIVNKDYDIEYVNPVIKNNFGSVEGKKCYKYFHESNEPCIFCKNKDVLAGKTVQWQWTSPKNNKVYDLTDMPLKNPDGSISKIEIFRDITERKQAEKKLAELSSIVEQSTDSIIKTDTDFLITYMNHAAEKLFGWKLEEIKGKTPAIFNAEPLSSEIQEQIYQTVSEGKIYSGEALNKRKDGSIFHCLFTSSPIIDALGQTTGYMGFQHDITKRKQAEVKLKESEKRFKKLSNLTSEGIMIHDEGIVIDLNESLSNLLGYSSEELIGGNIIKLCVLQEYHETVINNIAKKYGKPYEIKVRKKDGTIIPIEIEARNTVSENKSNRVTAVRDITERKLAEKKLESSNTFLNQIVELSPFAMWVSDRKGTLIRTNQSLRDTLKLTDEQLIGKYNVLKDDNLTKQDLMPLVQNVFDKHEPTRFTMKWSAINAGNIEFENNCTYFIELSIFPIVNTDGDLTNTVCQWVDITERKQAEEELRKSGAHLRTLIETIPDMVWLKDPEGIYLACNPRFERFFGAKKSEIVGKTDYDFVDKELADFFRQNDRLAIASEIPCVNEEEVVYADDGHKELLETIKTAMYDSEGKPVGVLGVGRNITERKQAEEKLRKSKEKFKKYINYAPDAIFIADSHGKYIEVNEAACKMTGYSKSELTSMTIQDIIHSRVNTDELSSFEKLKNTGSAKTEFELRRKDKSIIWASLDAVALSEDRFMAFCSDITERKRTEETNARLLRAIEQADETIVITDIKGVIQYVNPAFEKTTGYSIKEVIGQNPRILKSGQHHSDFYKKMWETISGGNEWSGEIINKIKDGTLITENVVISPVFNSNGEIVNYVAAKNDITETKRLQELEARAGRLETAGTIAGQVAHDFNNLLAPLIAYPDFIRDELPKNHPTLSYLDQMEKAAEKIANINQDLLAMGRRGHYNQEIINLNTIAQQAVAEIDPLPKTLAFELDLCKDLMDIRGGSAQLHRVISNMLHNAQDAMQNIGQITIKTENFYVDDVSVLYSRVPKGEYVKLTIADTGYGIPDDIVQKIFDPFFTSKTTDKKRGSGLGMSVVDAVIKDHKGYIDLVTKVGEGTSFYIYFPITRKSKNVEQTIDILGGDESLLIVDDDEVQRHVSSQILTKLSYQITSVDSGEKAIELIKNKNFELVILDMIMPNGIDGAETYRKILEISPGQKAIIVSGFSESNRVIEAQKLGVGVFVQKPLTKEAIASAVRNELDKKNEIVIG
ncbi:MAG: PAS domain S-box protein, partial [candidate division Zixibacteria bacterium]|nr:PAS domain S-box protein [candidate division Zixibacteria bacterium]